MKFLFVLTFIIISITFNVESNVIVYRTRKYISKSEPESEVELPIAQKTNDYCCDVLEYTNDYRNRYRLTELIGDTRLDEAALIQCKNLIKVGNLVHDTLGTTLSSRVSRVNYEWGKLAENILFEKGYGAASPYRAVDQWENSPGHASNMRGDYNNIGSAFCESDSGRIYWVQVFGSGDNNNRYKYSKNSCKR